MSSTLRTLICITLLTLTVITLLLPTPTIGATQSECYALSGQCTLCMDEPECSYCFTSRRCDSTQDDGAHLTTCSDRADSTTTVQECRARDPYRKSIVDATKYTPDEPEEKSLKSRSVLPVLCVLVFFSVVFWLVFCCRTVKQGNQLGMPPSTFVIVLAMLIGLINIALIVLAGWFQDWSTISYPWDGSKIELVFGMIWMHAKVSPDGIDSTLKYSTCKGDDEIAGDSSLRFCLAFYSAMLFVTVCCFLAIICTLITLVYAIYGLCKDDWLPGLAVSAGIGQTACAAAVATWGAVNHVALESEAEGSSMDVSVEFKLSFWLMCPTVVLAMIQRSYWHKVVTTAPVGVTTRVADYPMNVIPGYHRQQSVAPTAGYNKPMGYNSAVPQMQIPAQYDYPPADYTQPAALSPTQQYNSPTQNPIDWMNSQQPQRTPPIETNSGYGGIPGYSTQGYVSQTNGNRGFSSPPSATRTATIRVAREVDDDDDY